MSFNLDGLSFGDSSSGGGGKKNKGPASPFAFAAGTSSASKTGGSTSGAGAAGGFSFGSPTPPAAAAAAAAAAAGGSKGGNGGGGGGFSFGSAAAAPGGPAATTSKTSFGFGSPPAAPAAAASSANKPPAASAAGGALFPPMSNMAPKPFGGGGGGGGGGGAKAATASSKRTAPAPSRSTSSSGGSSSAGGGGAGAGAGTGGAFPPMSSKAPSNPFGASSSSSAGGTGGSSFPPMSNIAPKPSFGGGGGAGANAGTKAATGSAAAPRTTKATRKVGGGSGGSAFPPMSSTAPKPFGTGSGGFGGGMAPTSAAGSTSSKATTAGLAGLGSAASFALGQQSGRAAPPPPAETPPTQRKSTSAATAAKNKTGLNFNDGALVPIPGPGSGSGSGGIRRQRSAAANLAAVESKFPPEALGRLSCLGPDGRSVHSVTAAAASNTAASTSPSGKAGTEYCIITHFLPLSGTADPGLAQEEEEKGSAYSYSEVGNGSSGIGSKKRSVDIVKTSLPEDVAASLAVDPPIGLICVDNESSGSGRRRTGRSGGVDSQGDANDDDSASLPLLCLYTARSAYVLQITYSNRNGNAEAKGTVSSSFEPYEQHLLSAPSSTQIVTILPGPGCGYQSTLSSCDVLCRPGSMAALLSSDGEDSLALFHGSTSSSSNTVTVPLKRGYEDLGPDSSDTIVDVCFVSPSPAASDDEEISTDLFPSLSILLLSRTGCVHAASPIIFDGALYSRRAVVNASRYLRDEVDRLDNNNPAKPEEAVLWRRVKAAVHFIDEAFGTLAGSDRSMYAKASALPSAMDGHHSSKEWPIAVQGPLLAIPDTEDVPSPSSVCSVRGSSCIVPFSGTGASSCLVSGFAVGRVVSSGDGAKQPRVHVGILSAGATVLPRFEFESEADADCLDEILEGVGAIVEVVQFESPGLPEEGEATKATASRCTLIPDPVGGSTLHHVTERGVVTVTTNAVDVIGRRMGENDQGEEEAVSTSAWSLLEVSAPAVLEGVGVSGDAHLGHVLVARSSDGSVEAVNVTAAQYLHEASKLASENVSKRGLVPVSSAQTESDEALKAMESLLPLHELIAPLFQEISSGLAGMGKIVGGATRPQDATPGTVATVLDTKASCEKEIILPLKDLHRLTTARRQILQDMYESQTAQIEQLRNMVDTLRERMDATNDKMAVAEANATALSQRSAAALSAARDLVPTITEAEHQYFTQLKRYEASCKKWQGHIDTMKSRADKVCDTAGSASCSLEMNPDDMTHMNELLKGQGNHLKLNAKKIDKLERETTRLVKAVGLQDAGREGANGKENVQGQ